MTTEQAIKRSKSHNEIVRLDVVDAIETLAEIHQVWGDKFEWTTTTSNNRIDVWGWSESSPAEEQDWRLLLVVSE